MRKVLLTIALAAACVLAGCDSGNSGNDGGQRHHAAVTAITIGTVPVADFASAYIAESQGYFKDEGLTVTMSPMQNAASIVPSVLNGQITVGTAASVPFVIAINKGLPLAAVAVAASTYGDAAKETKGLYVLKDSPIKSVADLGGHRVGVNALKAVLELGVDDSVERAGAKPADVKFLAMPFPDMLSALKAGRIDAAALDEPFSTQAENEGMRLVTPLFADLPANSPNAVYFFSKKYAAEHPDVVKKFTAAIAKGMEYAIAHPDYVRKSLGEFSKIDARTIADMRLPNFNPDVKVAHLMETADLMKKYGFIDKVPSVAALEGR